MTIILPEGLPAVAAVRAAGEPVVTTRLPGHLDGLARRRLKIVLVNLMPDKPVTEIQFAHALAGHGHAVDLRLARLETHVCKTTPASHLARFYTCWRRLAEGHVDGVIITGAPVETLPFEAVDYWSELTALFDWAALAAPRTLAICWGAQALLYHRHGVDKQPLPVKAFGVYDQVALAPYSPYLHGLGRAFPTPVSRHTTVRAVDLPSRTTRLLAASPWGDPCLVEEPATGAVMMFNHLEYGADTLAREYARDVAQGRPIDPPANYFPANDPAMPPIARWRGAARRFYGNWLDQVAAARRQRMPDIAPTEAGAGRGAGHVAA